jgi:zinc protease
VALNFANHLLGGPSLNSRLNVSLRQQGGLTYGAGSQVSAPLHGEAGGWTLQTSMAPENREKVLAVIRTQLATLLRDGFSASELEAARKDLLEARRQALSNDNGLAARITDLAERDLDWRYTEGWDVRYRKLTLDELNAALRKYLKPDAWVVSSAGDYEKKPPLNP